MTDAHTAPLPHRRARFALIVLAAAALALTILLTIRYVLDRQQLEQSALEGARSQAAAAAQQIDSAFADATAIADAITDDLSNGTLPYAEIDERLWAETTTHPDIDGLAITFEPFVYDAEQRLYVEYRYKQADGTFTNLLGATYDYTQPPSDDPNGPQTAWYHNPLENGPMWNEPFLATGAGKVLIEYGAPFYHEVDGERVPAGVVTIDYSLQDMRQLMNSLELGATGYGFVVSSSGTFLTHPVAELVVQSSIFDLATSLQDDNLREGAQRALNGERVMFDGIDQITMHGSWTFFEPLPNTGWALGIVMNKSEFMLHPRRTLREQITIALSAAAFGVFALAVVLRANRGTNRSLWAVSGAFSLLGIALIALICFLATNLERQEGVQVTDYSGVQSYLENYISQFETSTPPIIVPTGIFVQAIDFPDPTSVTINGYIWQRYDDSIDENVLRGFTLPQLMSEQYTLNEVERQQQNGAEVIIWYFGVKLRQAFNPVWFPFDTRDIAIRITPQDLSSHIILTPDFDAYDLINPRLLPGVDPAVTVNNWNIESSSFSYQQTNYNTSFGLSNQAEFGDAPELYFTINTQRNFLGPFIAYLLPGIVIALMLFAFLLYEDKPDESEEIVTTLNYTAALFFVIAITHTALRDNIGAVGVTYLEHLYILLYIVIIVVAVNTFLIVKRPNFPVVHYRNNLIVKVLYWPVFVGVLLIVTLLVFVYS
jgi:hypothetical protein